MAATIRTAGAWASGSTSISPALPATPAAGDMMVLFVSCKPYNATINEPSGWTRLGTQQTNGSTTSGIDTGSVTWSVFYRAWQSGDAAPSVSITSGNVTLGVVHAFRPTSGYAIDTPAAYFGSDTSSGTGYSASASGSSGNITNGDALLHATVIAGNNATFGTPTLSATSATIGTVTENPATEGSTATGNDLEASSATATCTAGTSTADAACGWTLSVAQTGGSALVVIREAVAPVTGSLSVSETGSDTFAGTGDVFIAGSLAATESGADTFASTGKVIVKGSLAVSETGSDTFAASGTVGAAAITGTLAATESGSDTFASAGKVIVKGSLAVSETGADTFAASGDVIVRGALAASESADSFAATGKVIVKGALAVTEAGADTFTASGTVSWGAPISGDLAATESGSDSFTASGTVAWQPITGSLAASEAADTLAATGKVIVQGALAVSEATDTFAASGTVSWGPPVFGTLAASEAGADAFAAAGTVAWGVGIAGDFAAIELPDVFIAAGGVVITGTFAVSETGADTFSGGERPLVMPPAGSGFAPRLIASARPASQNTTRPSAAGGRRPTN